MTEKEKAEKEFEVLKLMYDNVYDELNRSRDWPIKIMAFATGVDVAIYGLLKFNDGCHLPLIVKLILVLIVVIVTWFTRNNIRNQHIQYTKYRSIQVNIQNKINIQVFKVDETAVFPDHWWKIPYETEIKNKKIGSLGLGWRFYVTFILALAAIAIVLIIIQ